MTRTRIGSAGGRRLSARDLQALRFIGEGYEVAQYQLQDAVFGSLSPTVTSRFVQRAVGRGLVATERQDGIGMNRLRLTVAGRESLAGSGQSVDFVFAPRRSIAPKDLQHTLRINDLRVVLAGRATPPSDLLPSWALQRSLAGDVIPDLLAVWRGMNGTRAVLACEIDLGTEGLEKCFLPKLHRLARSVRECGGEQSLLLVLTQGRGRLEKLRNLVPMLQRLIALELPRESGSRGLLALKQRLELAGKPAVVDSSSDFIAPQSP